MVAPRARPMEIVLAALAALARRGIAISRHGLEEAGERRLLGEIRLLGGLRRARRLGGLPQPVPDARRLAKESLLAEIERRDRAGEPLTWSEIPAALRHAAASGFGSWRAAVLAAGLDYRSIRLGRRQSPV